MRAGVVLLRAEVVATDRSLATIYGCLKKLTCRIRSLKVDLTTIGTDLQLWQVDFIFLKISLAFLELELAMHSGTFNVIGCCLEAIGG